MQPKAYPVLEPHRLPMRDLARLIELVGQHRVQRELNVHRTTIKRWLDNTVTMPAAQHLAVKWLLGDLPGTVGKWNGWRFHDGVLLSPAGDAFNAGDVLSLILLRQQLSAQRREIDTLRVRLAVAEAAQPQAANASAAV